MTNKVKIMEEIKTILRKLKPEARKNIRIKEMGVFGSYIKGKQRKIKSDLDIIGQKIIKELYEDE